MRQFKRTWVVGGAGLIACGVIGMLRQSFVSTPQMSLFFGVTADILYAAAVALLAIGLTREASVVARRPLGVTALLVVAAWPLVTYPTTALLSSVHPQGYAAAWMVFGYVALVVPIGAGLIAALQIARAGVVDGPARWAPLGVLGLHVLAWVVPQLTFAAVGAGDAQLFVDFFMLLGSLAFLAGTLGLGVVALVLAARQRPSSVTVYTST